MRRLPPLVIALLLPASPPLLLGTAAFTGVLLVSQSPARALSAEAVAKVAQAITVRIEGVTQGSGVLVKREGNRYTVLTAWHVVSGQRPGEELAVITHDQKQHNAGSGRISRIGNLDLATLEFTSEASYDYSPFYAKEMLLGDTVYVCGYRLAIDGARKNSKCEVNQGTYLGERPEDGDNRFSYNATTYPGFSGAGLYSYSGHLIGIHTGGVVDATLSALRGNTTKTGINTGILLREVTGKIPGSSDAPLDRSSFPRSSSLNNVGRRRGQLQNHQGDCGGVLAICQDRNRSRQQVNTITSTGKFVFKDFSQAAQRKCLPTAGVVVDAIFNAFLPWEWFKRPNYNCVGYTLKARVYSEVNANSCGIIVTRFGPDYSLVDRSEYGIKDEESGRHWDKLNSDRQEGIELLSKKLEYAIVSDGQGTSTLFKSPNAFRSEQPNLAGISEGEFELSERSRFTSVMDVTRVKSHHGITNNLVFVYSYPDLYSYTPARISVYFSDGTTRSIAVEKEKDIAFLSECKGSSPAEPDENLTEQGAGATLPSYSTRNNVDPVQTSAPTALYAWRLNPDGVLELRTRSSIPLQALYEEGRGLVGPRVWIDLPGSPQRTRTIAGSGAVRHVRVGRPGNDTTRLVVEFQPGTPLDPTKLRLQGTAIDRWRMQLGASAAAVNPIGEGDL